MFGTQQADSQAASQASDNSAASYAATTASPGTSVAGMRNTPQVPSPKHSRPSAGGHGHKNTLSAAISDLKTDLREVVSRLDHMESAVMTHGVAIQQVQTATSVHSQHLIDMHRHMEDLDNRGRRCNVRLRGIPESVEGPQLQPVVWAIFITLLGRPLDTPVDMERCHKVLRPRGRDTDPSRDAVCCLVNFTKKRTFYVQHGTIVTWNMREHKYRSFKISLPRSLSERS